MYTNLAFSIKPSSSESGINWSATVLLQEQDETQLGILYMHLAAV